MYPDLNHLGAFWACFGAPRDPGPIFWNLCVVLYVTYVFPANWGLNHLEFSGYNKIYPDFNHFGAFQANFGALRGP